MATLTIRNLPEDVHLALKERAQKHRRSLNQEVISELSASTKRSDAGTGWKQANVLVDEMRAKIKRFMTTEEIDAAIREDRR